MNALIASSLILMVCCGAGQAGAEQAATADTSRRALSATQERLVQADNRFGFSLFKEVVGREGDANVFVSPLSVAMALAMTYNGAAGTTAEAMKGTLELGALDASEVSEAYRRLITQLSGLDDKVRFDIANSIWYRSGFELKKEFLDLDRQAFGADVTGLDFDSADAADRINAWVSEKTNAKIAKIVNPPIGKDLVMLLLNAMYFKGTWTYEFDKNLTRDDTFTLPDGSKRPCKMMVKERDFEYLENEELQAIDLPYGGGTFRMTVLLPRAGGDVNALIASLSGAKVTELLGKLAGNEVALELPKFRMEYERTLNDVLAALGMGIAFDPGKADFSGMYEGPEPLSISEVKHKTFVQVDEEGTEAAAVTSVGVRATAYRPPLRMRVDRPFVFFVRDSHSQGILFMGKVVEPAWE
jgi:serine protease inhibitor